MKKQGELPTMETPSGDKELDAAAVNLKALSKKRKRAQDAEIEGREILERLMKDKKFTIYRSEEHDLVVTLSLKERVKVEEAEEKSDKAIDDSGDDDEIEMADAKEQKAKKKKAPSSETPAEA